MALPWSASWTEYFYRKCFKRFKGHTDVFVGELLSLKLCLTRGFSLCCYFDTLLIHTCLFHVQYQASASVMMYKLLCKYLLLNYYCFRSEFPEALKY